VIDSPIGVPADLSRLKYELELFLIGGDFDLYEEQQYVSTVAAGQTEADVSFGKLILSCWGDGWSRSWRVIGGQATSGSLRLDCTKRMGMTRCVVELRRGAEATESTALSRTEYAARLGKIIESNLPDFRVERAIIARDDRRCLSGVYVRLTLKAHGKTIAGIGVGDCEPQPAVDAALAAGIIWLEELRRKHRRVDRLALFVPRGRAATIATRLTAVQLQAASVSLYEVDEASGATGPIAAFDQGDLSDAMRRMARRALWPRDHTLDPEVYTLVDSVVQLAPDVIETSRRGGYIIASIRGLELARISIRRKRVEFGADENRQRLGGANRVQLERLVADAMKRRTADRGNRNDLLFRAQPERWLESLIRRDVSAVDATLDQRYVYFQVPTYRGEQRSYIDLLSVTSQGRLVILELKVVEDLEFPFQALDYWLRVEWHRLRGDFQRRGYFKGLTLADSPPLLYLVAPLFRFHATTGLIGACVSSRVPLFRIGINEDWRSGVKVLSRERLN
jgi:hypothetical protein